MSVLSMMGVLNQDNATSTNKPIAIAPKSSGGSPSQDKDGSTTTGSAAGDPGTPQCMPYTCLTCARRKVKCDKLVPRCSTCTKARLDCSYQEPAPRKRKRRPAGAAGEGDLVERLERLELYEQILKANGLFPGGEGEEGKGLAGSEPQWPFLASSAKGSQATSNLGGKLVGAEGKARYIGSTVFHNLGVDIEPSSDEDEDDESAAAVGPVSTTPATAGYQFGRPGDPLTATLLSPGTSSVSLLDYHPTYETATRLWRAYVDNVDPLVKVVHVPTMQKILQRSAAQPSGISRPLEALLFSIYHFSVTSSSEEESIKNFGEARATLLARYDAALRQALANAQWLRSVNIQVMQAFLLYLLSVRSTYDPSSFWILTGCAVRLAQRLGLHRDGEELGLKAFDTQMRRRMFWQILPLDGLAGQLSGTGICITRDSWTTKPMLNLDDTDIWPEMTTNPEERTGATDMIFCLARTEMAKIIRSTLPSQSPGGVTSNSDDLEIRDRHLLKLEDEVERKYLRYCEFVNPLHQVTMAMARAGINGGRLRVRLNRAKTKGTEISDAERKDIWTIANKIIDYHISANTNGQLQRFWWHIKAFFQSEALAWILNELRRDPERYKDEDSWRKIEATYAHHHDLAEQKRSLHLAVGRLTLKAWDATQAYLQQTSQPLMEEKPFLERIRARSNRKETSSHGGSSSGPTPETMQYNPFNPGDASDDLVYGSGGGQANAGFNFYPLNMSSGLKGSGGESYGSTPSAGPGFPGQGLLNPVIGSFDFDFNQMVDPNTGSIDWMFWDQLAQEPNAAPASWYPA